MIKKIIISLFLIFSALGLKAQYNYSHPEIFHTLPLGPEKYYADKLDNGKSDNPGLQYRLQTGMQFYSLNGFNTVSSWLSPKVLLPVNSKVMIEVGASFISSSFPGGEGSEMQRINDLITFARGIYSVNENFTVYGQVAKSILSKPGFENSDFESVMMGMEYYISPNFSIGASITSRRGMDPFYMGNPYNYSSSPWGPYF
jgi:hypothetical protein